MNNNDLEEVIQVSNLEVWLRTCLLQRLRSESITYWLQGEVWIFFSEVKLEDGNVQV